MFPRKQKEITQNYFKTVRGSIIHSHSSPQEINISRFETLANSLPLTVSRKLIEEVLEGLKNNFSCGYRGFSDFVQDHSRPENPDLEDKKLAQAKKEIELGRIVGGWDRPPFPNSWNPNQPKIGLSFSIPKNKYDPDNHEIRVIHHESFPQNVSKNTLTPRNDSGMPYWKILDLFETLDQLGENTLLFTSDVKSAYRILPLKPSEWHLQVLKIKGKFFVDKVGVFGNVRAGDNWDQFMRVDLDIARTVLETKYLFSYVDNYICCIPPTPDGQPDFKVANQKFSQYQKHYESLGIPLHKFQPPTLMHLGWHINTKKLDR